MAEEASLAIILRARDEASKTIAEAEGTLNKLGKAALAVGAVASVAMIGMGAEAVHMAADFQYTTQTLVTGAGEDQKALAMVRQGVLDMAAQVGQTPQKLAEGLYLIESAGFHGAEGLKVLKTAAMGATVGAADMASVSDALTSALNAYRMPASEAAHVTDILLTTVAAGKMHLSDLAANIGKVLPIASIAKIPISEMGAAIATMTAQGTDASMATTALRFLITNLISPSHEAAIEMQKFGLSAKDLSKELSTKGLAATMQDLQEHIGKKFPVGSQAYIAAIDKIVGGTRGMTAALELTGPNMKTFIQNAKDIGHASDGAGKLQEGWAEHSKDFNIVMERLHAGLDAVMISIGDQFLPVLSDVGTWFVDHLPDVQKFVNEGIATVKDAFNNAGREIQIAKGYLEEYAPLIGGLAGGFLAWQVGILLTNIQLGINAALTGGAGLGAFVLRLVAVTLAMGPLAAATALWNILLTANPIGLVVVGIALLVGGLIFAYQHVEGFRTRVDAAWKGIQQFAGFLWDQAQPAIAFVAKAFEQIATLVMPAFIKAGKDLQPTMQELGKLFWVVVDAIKPLGQFLIAFLGPAFAGIAVVIGALLSGVFGALRGFLMTALPTAIQFAVNVINLLVDIFRLVAHVFSNIVAVLNDIAHGDLTKLMEDLHKLFFQLGEDIMMIVGRLVKTVVDLVVGLTTTVIATVWGLVSGVIGFFQWLWDKLVGHSIIPDMVNSIVNWFKNLGIWALGHLIFFALQVLNWAQNLWQTIVKELQNLPGQVGNVLLSLMVAIGDKEWEIINAAVKLGKNFVSSIMKELGSLPGKVAGFIAESLGNVGGAVDQTLHRMHVPGFASGAVVRSGGGGIIARIGEGAEDEVVATATQMAAVGSRLSSGGGRPQTIIVPVTLDGRVIAQVVATYQARQFNLQGGRLGSGAG